MASQNEAEFVDELTEDNICSICTNLLHNPMLTLWTALLRSVYKTGYRHKDRGRALTVEHKVSTTSRVCQWSEPSIAWRSIVLIAPRGVTKSLHWVNAINIARNACLWKYHALRNVEKECFEKNFRITRTGAQTVWYYVSIAIQRGCTKK